MTVLGDAPSLWRDACRIGNLLRIKQQASSAAEQRCHVVMVSARAGGKLQGKGSGKKAAGQVSLVLGAGNQTPVACMDILHKLFVDDAVVVCKMNPVNEYLGEYIRQVPYES